MVASPASLLFVLVLASYALAGTSRGEVFGGAALAATPPGSAGSGTDFPENPRRDLALQDDGSVWVAEPGSRTVIVFAPGLGVRSTLELDAAVPIATMDAPFDGVVGIAAIPGDPVRPNLILLRNPRPRIGRVEVQGGTLKLTVGFIEVRGLPEGSFLEGLDRNRTTGELLTLDEANRRAIVLGPDYTMRRQFDLLGEGNPLSGSGIAWLDGERFLVGSSFGRPFRIDLALEYSASSGLYSGFAVPLDSVEGILAGGLGCGDLAGQPALYAHNVPMDQVAAVALRRVPAPPPAQVSSIRIPGGRDLQFSFQVDPDYGIEEVVVRENGVVLASIPPSGTYDLRGAVGTSALEFETRSGGVESPIEVPVHLFNGDWIPGENPHQRFRAIPFDPGSPDFDPLDRLSGLALDWKGTREESRLYVSTRRSRTVRIFDGLGESAGSFDHHASAGGTSGLALAGERDPSGRPRLMLLDTAGSPPPAGDGLPRWFEIDLRGNVLAEGPIRVDLLEPSGPGAVDFGDWDDLPGGYVVHDNASGRICWIDGERMAVTKAVKAPTSFLSEREGSPGPGGAAAALPNGMVLLAGGPPGSGIATDAWLLTGPGDPSAFSFTGFSLAVLDLAVFRIHFCDSFFSPACPPSQVYLPGIGFSRIDGLEAAYEDATGYDLAYFLTPSAVAIEYFDGSTSAIGTQGILTRSGARSRPDLAGERLFDGTLDLAPGGSAATPALRMDLETDDGTELFFHVINPRVDADLVLEARVTLDGSGSPAFRESVTIPPGRFLRRRVGAPRAQKAVIEIAERSGKAGTAHVLAGALGRPATAPRFIRGDVDAGGGLDITDALVLVVHLFLGGAAPPCPDAADFDDTGSLEVTDAVALLAFLYLGGDLPPEPGPTSCGPDPSPDEFPGCAYGECF